LATNWQTRRGGYIALSHGSGMSTPGGLSRFGLGRARASALNQRVIGGVEVAIAFFLGMVTAFPAAAIGGLLRRMTHRSRA
jgi:hypothetical protein